VAAFRGAAREVLILKRTLSVLALACATGFGCSPDGPPKPDATAPAPSASPKPALQPPPSASARSFVVPSAAALPDAPVVLRGGGARAARGEHGVVTSVEAHATRAGIRILEAGGNAVDAAVAVAYALAVTHPSAGNLGGGGFMLVRAPGKKTVAIDFRETAPARFTRARFDAMIEAGGEGAASVGVPGSVAGLNLAHRRFGRLKLADVLAPAIELAARGHPIGAREAATLSWSWASLKKDPAARRMFGAGKGDKPLEQGKKLRRADLARTLERIAAEGDAGFYGGEVAKKLLAGLASAGLMTLDDLKSYRAREREPMRFRYRGLEIETMPPPSAGGVALAQILLSLERLGAHRLPRASADELHLFLEASRRAQTERRFAVSDPDALAPEELRKRIARWTDPLALLTRVPAIDPAHATPSRNVHPLYAAAMRELEHTTHFSVVDAEGGIVSCTTTLSAGFGAKIVAPGTGVVLNNSLSAFGTVGESQPAPNKRTTSSMAPTLVLERGKPVLVLGTPGGDTIPGTITQVLRNIVDFGMALEDAVDAPRLHHGFVPDEVRYEQKRPPPRAVLDGLKAKGHRFSTKLLPIGDANDAALADRVAWAYADRREGGLALAARPRKDEQPLWAVSAR
jgi:gamma-glutamyltranspeptidase / glutathione hydrolase